MFKNLRSVTTLVGKNSNGIKKLFGFAVFFTFFGVLFSFITPQVIGFTVDSIVGEDISYLPFFVLPIFNALGGTEGILDNLVVPAVVCLFFSLLSAICIFCYRSLNSLFCEKFIKNLRNRLFEHIQKLPFSWHTENLTGDIIQRCTADVEMVRTFCQSQLIEVIRTVFLVTASLAILISIDATLSIVTVVFLPVIFGYSWYFSRKVAKKYLEADEAEGDLLIAVQENLTAVRVVRAFGREGYELEKFDKRNKKFVNKWVNLGYIMGFYWGVGDFVTGAQVMAVVIAGTVAAVNGSISVGELIIFVSFNNTLIWPVRGLGRTLSEMSKAVVSIGRINDILKETPEDTEKIGGEMLSGDIVFDNVSYSFDGNHFVLQNINFTLKEGESLGVLGGTGSGKSTLILLLNRLYTLPEKWGKITIGGVDINNISLNTLRRSIAPVLQEPFLFSRTIRENIAGENLNADISIIKYAADLAFVDKTIESFDEGYNTLIGERGVTLSGGQRQRIAIARSLMKNSPYIVFDDSLSAVDAKTDYEIRRGLATLQDKKTMIIISHRINSLMSCDKIIVLDEGKITQMGSHKELIATAGTYKQVYDIQYDIKGGNDETI